MSYFCWQFSILELIHVQFAIIQSFKMGSSFCIKYEQGYNSKLVSYVPVSAVDLDFSMCYSLPTSQPFPNSKEPTNRKFIVISRSSEWAVVYVDCRWHSPFSYGFAIQAIQTSSKIHIDYFQYEILYSTLHRVRLNLT